MSTTTLERSLAINGGTPVTSTPIPPVVVKFADDEIEAASRVLRSGKVAQGAITREFEQLFAQMTDARHAIATSNGTTALQLAYHLLLGENESAIVPGWTFIATASMVRARPGIPVFAEVSPETFNIDVDATTAGSRSRQHRGLDSRLRHGTRLIVPVHLYGNPADITRIESFAKRHHLKVVYDAAQAHLATYSGRGIGAFGDAVTYSFYPTKNMSTVEGGMITTNDDALAEELRLARDHGMKVRYQHQSIGFNYRLNDVFAAIGLAQLKRLPEMTAKRQANAARLSALLAGIDGIVTPVPTPGASHVYHLYTCRLDPAKFSCSRDEFCAALQAEGCGFMIHYPRPLHRQPVFESDPQVDCAPLPVCEQLSREVFSLPVHHHLSDEQVEQVAEAVAKVAEAFRN